MRFLQKFRKKNIEEARDKALLFAVSLVCAIASWFIITMTFYPSESKTVTNIPVQFDIVGSTAEENGLQIIDDDIERHVRVSFDCSRTNYKKLDEDSIEAHVDFDNITTAGKKTMTVKITSKNNIPMSNISVYPSTIEVELDKMDSRSFTVKPKVSVNCPDDKIIYMDEVTCDPAQITITGPAAQLAKVAECYAVSEKSDTIYSTQFINSDKFILYTEDGKEINMNHMTAVSPVVMYVPVYTQKTVNIDALITDVPDKFDVDCIKYTVTPNTVTIATENPDINLPDPLQKKIPLSSLDIGFSQDYDLNNLLASNNVKNVSDIAKVNISLNSEGLASKEITINGNDISIINQPSDNNTYTITNSTLNVKVVGPEDIINDITAKDFSAVVDMLGTDTSMNQFQYGVTISCNSHNNVWVVANPTAPKVNVIKTAKEGTNLPSNASNTSNSN